MSFRNKKHPAFKSSNEKSRFETYEDFLSKNPEALAEYEKLMAVVYNSKPLDFASFLASRSSELLLTKRKRNGADRKKNAHQDSKKHNLDKSSTIVIDDSSDDDVIFVEERPSKTRKTDD